MNLQDYVIAFSEQSSRVNVRSGTLFETLNPLIIPASWPRFKNLLDEQSETPFWNLKLNRNSVMCRCIKNFFWLKRKCCEGNGILNGKIILK